MEILDGNIVSFMTGIMFGLVIALFGSIICD